MEGLAFSGELRYESYDPYLKFSTAYIHEIIVFHLRKFVQFLTFFALYFSDWSSSLLARGFVSFSINWRHGCWRIYCSNTICQASEGSFSNFFSILSLYVAFRFENISYFVMMFKWILINVKFPTAYKRNILILSVVAWSQKCIRARFPVYKIHVSKLFLEISS